MVATQDPTLPAWKGLFEWSIKHGDGTQPARAPTPEELAWFQEAMAANVQDVAQRMREIKLQLEQDSHVDGTPTVEQREELLDELLDIVEDVNFARDLRGVGGLLPLLKMLGDAAPGLRQRAAAVLGACAQNNAPVQQWLLEGGALPPLMAQLTDGDSGARGAAYTAVSCLVRGHPPVLDAFLQADGIAAVAGGLADAATRIQRKAAQLLASLCIERPAICEPVTTAGAAAKLPPLLGSAERDSREAALRLALALAQHPASAPALFETPDFEAALKRLRIALDDAPAADAEAAADEARLLARLEVALQNSASASANGGATEASRGRDAGGGTRACSDSSAEQPVLMLEPPPAAGP